MPFRLFTSVFVCAWAASPAWAGRPLVTDDAAVVPPGACQVETWFQHDSTEDAAWLLPACTLAGRFELTLGGAYGTTGQRTQVAQVKTLFVEADTGWNVGLAAGTQRHRQTGSDSRQLFAYIPLSRAFFDERMHVHLNAGWIREASDSELSWAGAIETRVAPQLSVFAEVFGEPNYVQVGAKWEGPAPRLQLDFSYGVRPDDSERVWTLGLVWVSERFF